MSLKQYTFYDNGEKICIKSRPRTNVGNLCGWSVWINGEKFFRNRLMREEAVNSALSFWIKRNTSEAV